MENILEKENSLFTTIKSCEKFSRINGMIIIGCFKKLCNILGKF